MYLSTEKRGRRLYDAGGVELLFFNFPKVHLLVKKEHNITFNIKTFKFTDCTCEYGSFYGVNKPDKPCYHIEACREWIKRDLRKELESTGWSTSERESCVPTRPEGAQNSEQEVKR